MNITDSGDLRNYQIEIPNFVFDLGLSADAISVYCQLLRCQFNPELKSLKLWQKGARAGLDGDRNIAALRELKSHELLSFEETTDPGGLFAFTNFTILDTARRMFSKGGKK